MGFRFNKRITIFPGVRVNIGLGGVSASVGPRGASVTVGKRGVRGNLGIPGTGMSYSTKLFSSKTQARTTRAEQKLLRAKERQERLSNIRLELNKDNGSVVIFDNYGHEILGRDRGFVFSSQPDLIQEWLEDHMDEINGELELLQNIFFDSPHIDDHPQYQQQEYSVTKPAKPQKPAYRPEPVKEEIPEIGFFANLFQSKRNDHARKLRRAENIFNEDVDAWQAECLSIDKQYEQKLSLFELEVQDWKKAKAEHDAKEMQTKNRHRAELETELEVMEVMLADTLSQMEWPRETHVDFNIADQGSVIWLDVDLPEIEDLPQKIASLAADGRKLNIKEKTKKQLRLEYAQHIHGIGLRLACFTLSALPAANEVVISGYSQRLQTSTGNVLNDYLFSTKFTREGLNQLNFSNLENIDPIATHSLFENRKHMTVTGIFHAIEPYG